MRTPPLSRRSRIGIGVFYVFFFLYSVVVMQQILLGLLLPATILVLAYLGWRLARILSLYEQKLEREAEQNSQAETTERTEDEEIARLKRRYAEGEITEDVFEAELEQLLTTNESGQIDADDSSLDSESGETAQEREFD